MNSTPKTGMNNINSLKIREIFDNMSYPEAEGNLTVGDNIVNKFCSGWYQLDEKNGTVVFSSPEDVEKQLSDVVKADSCFPTNQKISFLLELSRIIEEYSAAVCQIEAKSRGILMRDTRSQALPFLTESLIFYSSLASEIDGIKGVAVNVLGDDTFLGLLGSLIGAGVASGHRIIFQVGPKIFPIVYLLTKLVENSENCPEHMFTIVPLDFDISLFKETYVKTVAVIDNFFQEKYKLSDILASKNFVAMETSFRSPMVVFSDADLDSACETVIEAAWSYQSLLPWSVNQLIVQESVFELFLGKLKRRLNRIKVGTANQQSIDITIPKYEDKVNEVVTQAKKMGLEVYQNDPDSNEFQPTLIIGGKVFCNRVISEDCFAPVVQVLSFRTITEGVALANNSRQGLAASIWTQNIDTAEEVAEKLTVTNVWINTHGNFTPMAPINFRKMSGVGYFGGREGFMEHSTTKSNPKAEKPSETKSNKLFEGLINDLKTSHETWKKLSPLERYKTLSETSLTDSLALQFSKILHNNVTFASSQGNYTLKSIKEAKGVIVILSSEKGCVYAEEAVLSSLLQGNAVIIMEQNKTNLSEISWPKNVPIKNGNVKRWEPYHIVTEAMESKEINAIGITEDINIPSSVKCNNMKSIFTIRQDWEFMSAHLLSVTKNIWSTKRQTF